MNYDAYLLSDHWRNLRKARLVLSRKRCESCGVRGQMLHVHHMNYRNLIDCTPEDLVTLCETCHRLIHLELRNRGRRSCDYTRSATLALIKFSTIPPKTNKLSKKQRRKLKRMKRRAKRESAKKYAIENAEIDRLAAEVKLREEHCPF